MRRSGRYGIRRPRQTAGLVRRTIASSMAKGGFGFPPIKARNGPNPASRMASTQSTRKVRREAPQSCFSAHRWVPKCAGPALRRISKRFFWLCNTRVQTGRKTFRGLKELPRLKTRQPVGRISRMTCHRGHQWSQCENKAADVSAGDDSKPHPTTVRPGLTGQLDAGATLCCDAKARSIATFNCTRPRPRLSPGGNIR